jgi:hypothetical protein
MTLLQEDAQSVGFDPMYVDGPQPWHAKLFGLYIVAVVILLAVRLVQIILNLRKLRKLEKAGGGGAESWQQIWGLTRLQARGLEKFAVLTFFLTGFEVATQVSDAFSYFATTKLPFPKWPFISLSRQIPADGAAILTCALLYVCGFFFESPLERRRLAVNTAPVLSQAATD